MLTNYLLTSQNIFIEKHLQFSKVYDMVFCPLALFNKQKMEQNSDCDWQTNKIDMLSLALDQTLPKHIHEKHYFPPRFTFLIYDRFIGVVNNSM